MKDIDTIIEEIERKGCPFCGNEKMVTAKQDGYAVVTSGGLRYSNLTHIICTECGSVVHSYANKPQRLLKRSERDE